MFLLSDSPAVISDRLGFRVVAGLFPKALESQDKEELRARLGLPDEGFTSDRGRILRELSFLRGTRSCMKRVAEGEPTAGKVANVADRRLHPTMVRQGKPPVENWVVAAARQ